MMVRSGSLAPRRAIQEGPAVRGLLLYADKTTRGSLDLPLTRGGQTHPRQPAAAVVRVRLCEGALMSFLTDAMEVEVEGIGAARRIGWMRFVGNGLGAFPVASIILEREQGALA